MSTAKGVLILFGCGLLAIYLSARIHQVMAAPGEAAGYLGIAAVAALVAWLTWRRRRKPRQPAPWMRKTV